MESGNVKFPSVKKSREKKAAADPAWKKSESDRVNARQKQVRAEETNDEKEVRKAINRQRMHDKREEMKKKKADKIKISINAVTADALSPKSRYERKSGYRLKNTLKKAVRRVQSQTPDSPKKKKAVIMELAKEAGLTVSPVPGEDYGENEKQLKTNAVTEDVLEKVALFYVRPDIVWTSPSLKDEITVWNESGEKRKLRKYYLEVTIEEAFALFKKKNPDDKIGLTKFYELKPPNVLFMKDSPADQCKCVKHDTFRMQLAPFKIQTANKEFWPKTLCSESVSDLNSACWRNECQECKDGRKLMERIELSKTKNAMTDDKKINWYVWEVQQSLTKSGKPINRQVKIMIEGFPKELAEVIMTAYPTYLSHVRKKRIMCNEFQDDLSKDSCMIVQVDFAMDYNCRDNANEIQSAIYGRKNVTIFTCAVYINKKWHSYAVLTDSDKYKSTVRMCMLRILQNVMVKFELSLVDRLIIWSDGPSNEFRNKFVTGKLLHEIMSLLKKPSTWKYFETSHGKGVCDGIGGALKARVASHVRGKHRDSVVVQDYVEFYNIVKPYVPKVTLILLRKKDVEESMKSNPWADSIAIPGVGSCHVSHCNLAGNIIAWELPRENKLATISYCGIELREGSSSSRIEDPAVLPPPAPPSTPISNAKKAPSDAIPVKSGSWYVIRFTDGKVTTCFLAQIMTVSKDKKTVIIQSYTATSYKHLTSSMKICFKRYPGPDETVSINQIVLSTQPPIEFLSGGKVLLKQSVKGVK